MRNHSTHFFSGGRDVLLTRTAPPIILWTMGIMYFLLPVLLLFYGFDAYAAEPSSDPFVQYIAGVEMLRRSRILNHEERVAYYKKLVEVTGINGEYAAERIRSYRGRPEKWKKINEAVISIIEGNDSNKKE